MLFLLSFPISISSFVLVCALLSVLLQSSISFRILTNTSLLIICKPLVSCSYNPTVFIDEDFFYCFLSFLPHLIYSSVSLVHIRCFWFLLSFSSHQVVLLAEPFSCSSKGLYQSLIMIWQFSSDLLICLTRAHQVLLVSSFFLISLGSSLG